jgi:hypothetical protein
VYERLVPFINEHAANGEILAGPDCPEVYFLTGKRNPTPMLFDFFVDQRVRDRQILRLANDPAIAAANNSFFGESSLYPMRRVMLSSIRPLKPAPVTPTILGPAYYIAVIVNLLAALHRQRPQGRR